MAYLYRAILASFLLLNSVQTQDVIYDPSSSMYPTLSSWLQQFADDQKTPKNLKKANSAKHSGFHACGDKSKQWQEFSKVLAAWLDMMAHGSLSRENVWAQSDFTQKPASFLSTLFGKDEKKYETIPSQHFFNPSNENIPFTPFAQKLIAKQGDQFYMRGDLHGDIFALLKQLLHLYLSGIIDNNFKLLQKNVWIVFLGDYVDRGHYGCEVLYTMMRLSLANSDRVVCVRGNHEDISIRAMYGFQTEVHNKFDDPNGRKHKIIGRMNDFMPVVFYLGCQQNGITNYIQCCHGGIEIGYNPQTFLDDHTKQYQQIGVLHSNTMYHKIKQKQPSYHNQLLQNLETYLPNYLLLTKPTFNSKLGDNYNYSLGFMWSDFDPLHNNNVTQIKYNIGRGFIYGKLATQDILQLHSSANSKIRGIIRAHQHTNIPTDPMMVGLKESYGVYKLWNPYEKNQIRPMHDGLVWTFNVGADSDYGLGAKFDFDTYAKVTVYKDYQEWKIQLFVQDKDYFAQEFQTLLHLLHEKRHQVTNKDLQVVDKIISDLSMSQKLPDQKKVVQFATT